MKNFNRFAPALGLLLIATSSLLAQTPATQAPATTPANPAPGMAKPPVPAPEKLTYNSIHTTEPVLAMTFDDGPNPKLTPKLLDLLKERNIKVTFFVVGENAEKYPEILQRIVAEGHEIGNHSWNHPALTKLSAQGVSDQINKTSDAIAAATGKKPTLLRPPYGAVNAKLKKRINDEFHMKIILWAVDPEDWRDPGAAAVTTRIVGKVHPGDIVLSHDIHAGTVEAMPAILDQLKAKGYRFVTVSELIAMDKGSAPSTKPAGVPATASSPQPTTASPLPPKN
ncbi:MAG: polysaccharide deacetylase family protein [Chthoniobacterales bacterium]